MLTYLCLYFIILTYLFERMILMGKKIKAAVFLFFIIISLSSATVFAENIYPIAYDYGIADIRFDYIENGNPDSYTDNDNFSLSSPICPGFDFQGWYADDEFTVPVTQIDGSFSGAITLYAKWYESVYNINYVLVSSGTELSGDAVYNSNPSSRLASEEIFLTAPDCGTAHYVFKGWYTDAEFKNPVTKIDKYTCEDVTLYAKWENAQYNITYDLGIMSSSVYPVSNTNPSKYEYSKEVVLEKLTTTHPAYSFEGWYTDEFFTHKVTSIPEGTDGNITLYANWNRAVYKINYVLADGSGISAESIRNSNPAERTADENIQLSQPVSEDRSYYFEGWYTSPDFTEDSKITEIKASLYEDITIYAKWKTAVYKITYNFGIVNHLVVELENNNPETYLFGEEISLEPLSADGFIFNGWCTDKNYKNHIDKITADTYGDITLYADFTEKTYTVTYVLADKEVTESQVLNKNPSIRTTSEKIEFEDPQTINASYEFGGWYFDRQFTQKAEGIDSYTTENVTVYAKWIKIISYVPLWGDITMSDEITAADARLALRLSANLEEFSDIQEKLADINNDGKNTAADARLILRLAANLENYDEITQEYKLPSITVKDGEIVFE